VKSRSAHNIDDPQDACSLPFVNNYILDGSMLMSVPRTKSFCVHELKMVLLSNHECSQKTLDVQPPNTMLVDTKNTNFSSHEKCIYKRARHEGGQ
jgi:hypothetical protein